MDVPWYKNPKTIDLITNICAFGLFIMEPIRAYLSTQQFSWFTFTGCIFSAVIGWFTSKSYQGSLQSRTTPTPVQNPTLD